MGAVDLVVQVESPKSVARGLQRVGRAGHELHSVSKGRIFPKFRADLLESAVVARAMRRGRSRRPASPQPDRRARAAGRRRLRRRGDRGRGAPRARAPRVSVRRPLARPARERPRHAGGALPVGRVRRASPADRLGSHGRVVRGRPGRAGWQSPTRGRFPTGASSACTSSTEAAAWASSTRRWCTRREGQTFVLGASTWRIEDITRDRVLVSPAPGVPGVAPFWKGEGIGRPAELGEKIGAATASSSPSTTARPRAARE